MTGTPDVLPRLYTAAEVAEALRRSAWWVKEQARQRRIPHCLMGGGYLFTAEHVAAIVRSFEVQPVEPDISAASTGSARRSPAGGEPGSLALVARVPRRARLARDNTAA